ncbi:MAG: hypothetical protein PVI69_14485 [Desulfobacterales bacterium]|jgi:hypothetical protein
MRLKSLILVMTILVMTFLAVENGQCEETGVQLKDLIGIWKPDTTNDMLISFIKFYDDGTYRIAYDVEKIETRPTDKGQIKLEGKDITFIPSESPMCKTNPGKYTIKKIEKGKFEFTVQEDPCDRRRCLFGSKLIRIKP